MSFDYCETTYKSKTKKGRTSKAFAWQGIQSVGFVQEIELLKHIYIYFFKCRLFSIFINNNFNKNNILVPILSNNLNLTFVISLYSKPSPYNYILLKIIIINFKLY